MTKLVVRGNVEVIGEKRVRIKNREISGDKDAAYLKEVMKLLEKGFKQNRGEIDLGEVKNKKKVYDRVNALKLIAENEELALWGEMENTKGVKMGSLLLWGIGTMLILMHSLALGIATAVVGMVFVLAQNVRGLSGSLGVLEALFFVYLLCGASADLINLPVWTWLLFLGLAGVHYILFARILGRWDPKAYKEYEEWLAFRRFLSDAAMLKKYAEQDWRMWREWLVYGVLFGVADKVFKALKEVADVEVRTSTEHAYIALTLSNKSIMRAYNSYVASRSGRVGSGFGGGGGIGGFGGGTR